MGKALIDGALIDTPQPTAEQRTAGAARRAVREARQPLKPPLNGVTFLARLTVSEYTAIALAAQQSLVGGDAHLALWIEKLRINGHIDLTGDDAQAAKAYLLSTGLLSAERAAVVFA